MLEQYGHIYFRCADKLGTARGKLHARKMAHPGEAKVYRDAEAHHLVMDALEYANETCARVPLGMLSREIIRTAKECQNALVVDRCGLALRNIAERFHDELEDKKFIHVSAQLASFYGQEALFGQSVFDKFKNARDDIKNAGNCLAIGQATATVFDLMRAMEVAVRHLARRPHINITVNSKTTWRQITGAMDAKIAAMPDLKSREKQKRENWEEARTNLHLVGSVWRNGTMHPAKSYTPSQARDVFDACKVFMNALCAL